MSADDLGLLTDIAEAVLVLAAIPLIAMLATPSPLPPVSSPGGGGVGSAVTTAADPASHP